MVVSYLNLKTELVIFNRNVIRSFDLKNDKVREINNNIYAKNRTDRYFKRNLGENLNFDVF